MRTKHLWLSVVTGAAVGAASYYLKKKLSSAPAAAPAAPKAAGAGVKVTSPLPGVIIEVSVKEGQAVKAGQKVAVIEAMKMEQAIKAPADGTVAAINVAQGDTVTSGQVVAVI